MSVEKMHSSIPVRPSIEDQRATGLDQLCACVPSIASHTQVVSMSLREVAALSRAVVDAATEPFPSDTAVLEALFVRLEEAAAQLHKVRAPVDHRRNDDDDVKGYFVKLTTRSPKDVIYEEFNAKLNQQLLPVLLEQTRQRRRFPYVPITSGKAAGGPDCDLITHGPESRGELISVALEAWLIGCGSLFKVTSVPEAIALLLRSTRVGFDLNAALAAANVEDDIEEDERDATSSSSSRPSGLGIVIKQWAPVPPSSEFRVFVVAAQVTAISQYYHHCYFPELKPRSGQLVTAIVEEVEGMLAPALHRLATTRNTTSQNQGDDVSCPFPDRFIVDVSVQFSTQSIPKVELLEMNPFAVTTSSCLFDWGTDAEVLLGSFRCSTGRPLLRLTEVAPSGTKNPLDLVVVRETKALLEQWVQTHLTQ